MIRYFSSLPLALLAAVAAHAASGRPVGGGILDGGLDGRYFANPDFSGDAAFTRHDVRVAFDWDLWRPIGGSPAPGFRDFPRDQFSVVWQGRLMPRFSETYTLSLSTGADETASLRLRPNGSGDWIQVIDDRQERGELTMEAGLAYDLEIRYAEGSGPALCRLSWSSPSTPEEIIEPVVESGLNAYPWSHASWADLVTANGLKPLDKKATWATDENNWPQSDFSLNCKMIGDEHGQFRLWFQGQARVEFNREVTIPAHAEQPTKVLATGVGYDPTSNTTEVLLLVPPNEMDLNLTFTQTRRNAASAPGTGLDAVRLLRPISPGGPAHPAHAFASSFVKTAFERYTCMRYLWAANFGEEKQWSQRLRPTAPAARSQRWGEFESYEPLIMFSNETGTDLYLTVTPGADDHYLENLAKVLCYGSDGSDPYDSPTENPVFPPLNPNLRVYIEIGNEMWNWAFSTTQRMKDAFLAVDKEEPEVWKILNFDGAFDNNKSALLGLRRYHAYRTVVCSKAMRRAFGDEAFEKRVRMLLEYQYRWAEQFTTQIELLDGYYNNGDGQQHVVDPQPYSHYIWGAGGATYYGVGNPHGHQDHTKLADGDFETQVLPDGATTVPDGAWSFSGASGIYRNSFNLIGDFAYEQVDNPRDQVALGYRFEVVDRDIWVSDLGRYFPRSCQRGSKRRLVILDATSREILVDTTMRTTLRWNARDEIRYTRLEEPVRLKSGSSYVLLSLEPKRGGHYVEALPIASMDANIKLSAAVRIDLAGENPREWDWSQGQQPGQIYPVPLLRFRYHQEPSAYPDLPDGGQAAWLDGPGARISQSVHFEKAGAYAISFDAAGARKGWPGHPLFHIRCDDELINAGWKAEEGVRLSRYEFNVKQFTPGKNTWGSAVFQIKEPGSHTISFEIVQDGQLFVDNIAICSADALIDSGLGSGQALGQIGGNDYSAMWQREAEITGSMGLPWVSYESGWSVGGDHIQVPLQNWTKCHHPKVFDVDQNIVRIWQEAGGFHPSWGVYTFWEDDFEVLATEAINQRPLVRSLDATNQRLPHEPSHGVSLPGILTTKAIVLGVNDDRNQSHKLARAGHWAAWLCLAPDTATYQITPEVSGDAKLAIEVDGRVIATMEPSAATHGIPVALSKGQHGLRIRSLDGDCEIKRVRIER